MTDDPYAVRARTHRSDRCGDRCQRCGKPYPCDKAGQADPESSPGCILAAVLGAMAAAAVLCIGCGFWLLGWWRP